MTRLPLDRNCIEDMQRIRHDLHAHPETAFEEHRTAGAVASYLRQQGIEVVEGVGRTGIVGKLAVGNSSRAIGLRADMDALHLEEQNTFAHASTHPGKMHGCGHDGHTSMLLGAARHLAATREFNGVVYFIFQPAEENEGGGRVMIEDGLFTRFPMEAVYGMHNIPGIPVGQFALMPGAMMAAFDVFEIAVRGRGTHAAMPHQGIDPLVGGAQLVAALQTLVTRSLDPMQPAVISVTQFHAGDTWNVIPDSALLLGTVRTFHADVQDAIEGGMRRISAGIAEAFGVQVSVRYERRYPATINSRLETQQAASVLESLVGRDNVLREVKPLMAGEDFAFMLQQKPGCYVWIGNGADDAGCLLHNPRYDFNDSILGLGASYWVRLVEHLLPK